MTLLWTLAAALALFAALFLLLWSRQRYLSRGKQEEVPLRPCGCTHSCGEHLHQIREPGSTSETPR